MLKDVLASLKPATDGNIYIGIIHVSFIFGCVTSSLPASSAPAPSLSMPSSFVLPFLSSPSAFLSSPAASNASVLPQMLTAPIPSIPRSPATPGHRSLPNPLSIPSLTLAAAPPARPPSGDIHVQWTDRWMDRSWYRGAL